MPGSEAVSDICEVTDTLQMARHKHPGQRNNLDALCQRYEIDNTSRSLHGALLDAEILAEVYLAMTGGQTSLGLGADGASTPGSGMMQASTVSDLCLLIAPGLRSYARHQRRSNGMSRSSENSIGSLERRFGVAPLRRDSYSATETAKSPTPVSTIV